MMDSQAKNRGSLLRNNLVQVTIAALVGMVAGFSIGTAFTGTPSAGGSSSSSNTVNTAAVPQTVVCNCPPPTMAAMAAVTGAGSSTPKAYDSVAVRIDEAVFSWEDAHVINPHSPSALTIHPKMLMRFRPFSGLIPKGFRVNYFGFLQRPFFPEHRHMGDWRTISTEPVEYVRTHLREIPFDEDYLEVTAIAIALSNVDRKFTMVEFGAGYGPWLITGHHLCRQMYPNLPIKLIAVEPDDTKREEMLPRALRDNGVDSSIIEVINGVIGPEDGEIDYTAPVVGADSSDDWGQHVVFKKDVEDSSGLELGVDPRRTRVLKKKSTGLCTFLQRFQDGELNTIHIDIQGFEYIVLSSCPHLLQTKVRMLHIGTHNPEVDAQMTRFVETVLKWNIVTNLPCQGKTDGFTPYGRHRSPPNGDGMITALNPAYFNDWKKIWV